MKEAKFGNMVLRAPQRRDAEAIFRNYAHSAPVTKYMIWRPHRSLEESQGWIDYCVDNFDEDKNLKFIIATADGDEALGMVDATVDGFQASVGYVLAEAYWGQGIMTEALRIVIADLLAKPSVYRVCAMHDLENPASGRVMEKAGMSFEGILKRSCLLPNISDIPRDMKLWAATK